MQSTLYTFEWGQGLGKVASLKSKIQKVKVPTGKSKSNLFQKVNVTFKKSKSSCILLLK